MYDNVTARMFLFIKVVYDTESNGSSSTPHALRSHLSALLEVPLQHLLIAKHKVETFEWIIIEDLFHVKIIIVVIFPL